MRPTALLVVCLLGLVGCSSGPDFAFVEHSSALRVESLETLAQTQDLVDQVERDLDLSALIDPVEGRELVRGPDLSPASYARHSTGTSSQEVGGHAADLGDRDALITVRLGVFASGDRANATGEQPGHVLVAVRALGFFHDLHAHDTLALRVIAQNAASELLARLREVAIEQGLSVTRVE